MEVAAQFLAAARGEFRRLKRQAEKALAQVDDDALHSVLGPESNSLAILVRHLAGNMRSRWTDFLASDGEKPDRDRDSEFEAPPKTRDELLTTRALVSNPEHQRGRIAPAHSWPRPSGRVEEGLGPLF